jgi:hypothetical protein
MPYRISYQQYKVNRQTLIIADFEFSNNDSDSGFISYSCG